jgi:hypothetical protein
MKPLSFLFLCCVSALAGCGQPVAEAVDPDQAKQALRTALDAWKGGKTSAELEAQQPSIIMNESDWTGGSRLLDFTMDEAGRLDGRQVRWVVRIKLQDRSGKVTERKANYIIDTVPRIVIVRDSFAS